MAVIEGVRKDEKEELGAKQYKQAPICPTKRHRAGEDRSVSATGTPNT